MSMRKKVPIAEWPNCEKILRLFPTTTHVVLTASYNVNSSGVGCQATTLNGVNIHAPTIVDAGGKPTVKEPKPYDMKDGKIIRNPAHEEYWKLKDELFKDTDSHTYKALAETLWHSYDYNMYLIGDNLMKGEGTQKFAQWLVDNEYGIVTSSPGVINRCHRSDPHFCQVWIWVPPQATRFCVPARKPVVGAETMDPDAIVGQKMVNESGKETETYKVKEHNMWHKDLNFVKKALVLSKAEMKPKRVVRKKKIS